MNSIFYNMIQKHYFNINKMNEELHLIFDIAKESMSNAITHLEKKLMNIRAGKANPNMLSSVTVEYYGSNTPLSQVANINTPDGRTIIIQPWEKSILPEVEKGIEIANLGFNPMNNGETIIITVPALTEERRTELKKIMRNLAEKAKVSIRNIRREANDKLKKDFKDKKIGEDESKKSEKRIQNITDNQISELEKKLTEKEKEIMTV